MRPSRPLLSVVTLSLLTCASCRTIESGPFVAAGGEPRSTIRHIVFIDLNDANDAPALIRQMDSGIATIPGIVHYWRGEPFLSDRPEVTKNYDVGLIIDFENAEAYDNYVTDERHVSLVRDWKPKLRSLTVYDVRPQAADR